MRCGRMRTTTERSERMTEGVKLMEGRERGREREKQSEREKPNERDKNRERDKAREKQSERGPSPFTAAFPVALHLALLSRET